MKIINGLTAEPKQQTALILNDGSRVSFYLEYRPNQLGWFYDLTWGKITLNGQRLVASPNILRQFRARLPFGISVVTTAFVEPLNQADLSNGVATLYLMDAADVETMEQAIYTGS